MRKILVVTLAIALLLVGCSSGTQDAKIVQSDNNQVDFSSPITIRVASQPTSGQAFHYMADYKGYFEEESINVEMVYINNAADAFQSLSSGQVEVLSTYGTGGPLTQIANGQDFTIFGGYMIEGAMPVIAKPETEWNSPEDFVGKKVGVTLTGASEIILTGILKERGIDPTSVEFVNIKDDPVKIESVRSGQVDFAMISTGYQLRIEEAGLKIAMWPEDWWPNYSCCRMVAQSSWVEENPEAAKRLVRAYLKAERDIKANDEASLVVDLIVKNTGLDKATVESYIYNENLTLDTDPFKNSVLRMGSIMEEMGMVESGVDFESHIITSIYKDALNSLIEENPDDEFYKEKLEVYLNNNEA